MLIKRLTRLGSSHAIIIDKPIMDLLGLTPETEFEVTTDGRALRLVPRVRRAAPEQLQAAMDQVFTDHGEVLAKLAK
jgi:antitoxin component of MazEF toxin-antitoxin module